MHLPEMPVGAREFRGFRRAFRLRVELRQRKIAKHETKLFAEMLLHRLDDGKGSSASGALIVPVLDRGVTGACGSPWTRSAGLTGTCKVDMWVFHWPCRRFTNDTA